MTCNERNIACYGRVVWRNELLGAVGVVVCVVGLFIVLAGGIGLLGRRGPTGRSVVAATGAMSDQDGQDWHREPVGVWVSLGIVLFAGTLLDLVTGGLLRGWDHQMIPTARPSGAPEPALWQALADVGGAGVLTIVLVAAALLHLFWRRPVVQLVKAAGWILGIEAVIWLAKVTVGRTPPRAQLDQLTAGGMSWPSGHAADGLALLLIAATLLTRPGTVPDRISRWAIPVIAAGVAVATVRLHYHWPTDAIAGWALGLTLGTLARRSLRRTTTRPSTCTPRSAHHGRSPWIR